MRFSRSDERDDLAFVKAPVLVSSRDKIDFPDTHVAYLGCGIPARPLLPRENLGETLRKGGNKTLGDAVSGAASSSSTTSPRTDWMECSLCQFPKHGVPKESVVGDHH